MVTTTKKNGKQKAMLTQTPNGVVLAETQTTPKPEPKPEPKATTPKPEPKQETPKVENPKPETKTEPVNCGWCEKPINKDAEKHTVNGTAYQFHGACWTAYKTNQPIREGKAKKAVELAKKNLELMEKDYERIKTLVCQTTRYAKKVTA